MSDKLYLDVHVIQTVPPSCVNRDDTGSPKTATYGGVRRARVSSQSWKRAVRAYFKENFEGMTGIRTTRVVELVANAIVSKNQSVSKEEAMTKASDIFKAGGIKIKSKKVKGVDEECSAALMFISMLQIDLLADLALDPEYESNDKGKKEKFKEIMSNGNDPDIILFGRMLADDPSLNTDAACQVAHAISTHKVDTEFDYYTAVDEMSPEDTSGAGMIGTIEFNSSTLYRYATVAIHELAKQMVDGNIEISKVVTNFVKGFVLSMPTGKQNTFANRTVPDSVLLVLRKDQPVNLVGAFEIPVKIGPEGYAIASSKALAKYMAGTESFVSPAEKTWQIGNGLEEIGPSSTLAEALDELSKVLESEI